MKAIVCEMCGGNDLVKDQGVFICQNCGTKYSVEEAKKMMIDLSGKVDVSGSSVKIDNEANVKNCLLLAKNAYDNSNFLEAEKYSNKVIESEFENSQAWLIKGLVAGKLSMRNNSRFEESLNCYRKAFEYASDEDLSTLIQDIRDSIKHQFSLEVTILTECYVKEPTTENRDLMCSDIAKLVSKAESLGDKLPQASFDINDEISSSIYSEAIKVWNDSFLNYQGSKHPDAYEWATFLKEGDASIVLAETSLQYENTEAKKKRIYQSIIDMERGLLSSGCYAQNANGAWIRVRGLPQVDKDRRLNRISYYKKLLAGIRVDDITSQTTDDQMLKAEPQQINSGMPVWAIVLIVLGVLFTIYIMVNE